MNAKQQQHKIIHLPVAFCKRGRGKGVVVDCVVVVVVDVTVVDCKVVVVSIVVDVVIGRCICCWWIEGPNHIHNALLL